MEHHRISTSELFIEKGALTKSFSENGKRVKAQRKEKHKFPKFQNSKKLKFRELKRERKNDTLKKDRRASLEKNGAEELLPDISNLYWYDFFLSLWKYCNFKKHQTVLSSFYELHIGSTRFIITLGI